MLGFEAKVDLDEGLERTIAWYREKLGAPDRVSDPIRLARPDVGPAELAAVAEVIESGQLTMGSKVAEFESALAEAVGTAHAAAVSSGTAALHLALLALEIGPGDEVIVPAYTFPATANVVELCGARAVLVDIDPDTFLLDPAAVAAAVTPRTRAVMAVHLFGRPVEWEALQTSVPQEVVLLEDAAGALGAGYRGTPCGALGVAACLSFHPRKIVTTGEGGAVTTDEAGLDAAVRRFATTAGRRSETCRSRASTTGSPICSARSGSRSSHGSRSCLRLGSAWRAGTRSGSSLCCSRRARPRATGTAGRPTSSSSSGATRRWRGCARRGSRPRSEPGRCTGSSPYRAQGPFPGADRAFERALALPFATTTTEDEVDRVVSVLARFA